MFGHSFSFQWRTMQFNFVCWKLITLRCWPSLDVDVISYTLIQQFKAKKTKWFEVKPYHIQCQQIHIQRIWFCFFFLIHMLNMICVTLRKIARCSFSFGLISKIIKWISYYLCVPSWYKWLICRHIYIIWAIYSMKSCRADQN